MTMAVGYTEAARLHARGDIRVGRERDPGPGPGEVRIDVTSVGICGSDLHWFEEGGIGDARLGRPLVLGHEFAAVIADGPRAGERVAVDPADPCGHCASCVAGRENLCVAMRFAGHGTTDGALRRSMSWPERLLHRLPDTLTDDDGALLEPLGVAIHAVDLGPIPVGGIVGVYGCGPIGLLLVQLALAAGASSVVATDLLAHRVAAARAFGADVAFAVDERGDDAVGSGADTAAGPIADRGTVRETAVDVAFEAAGSDAALSDAIAAVRPGGRVVLVGIPGSDRTAFAAGLARRKELSLVMSRRMVAADLDRAIVLAGSGRIALAPLVTDRYPLGRTAEAFEAAATRRGLKTIVHASEAVVR